jgi:hypothetical protein
MPRRGVDDCDKTHPNTSRDVLAGLPNSQKKSTGARHKCAACAYEAGLQEGIRRARKALAAIARGTMPRSAVTGKRVEPESDLGL